MNDELQYQRNIKMFGCDPKEMLEFLKQTPTYTTMGKDTLVMSMLSDVQELIAMGQKEESRLAINRIKYVIQEL